MALTPRQTDALRIITARQATRRTGPTLRQLAKEMGVACYAVQRYVGGLRASGHIEPDSGYGLVVQGSAGRAPLPKPGGKLL